MPFTASIDDKNISSPKSTKLLFPISIVGQKNHTGERLKALIDLARNHNSTILIADTLHRHNLKGGEKEALSMGDKFLKKHQELFKDAVWIESAEDWEKYKKDETAVKLIRWSTWGKIKSSEFKEASDLIESTCQDSNSPLVKKLHETAQNSVSKLSISSSIAYQKEENAHLLTFSEFDYHCYPGPLNPSQAETVKLFNQHYKIPVHKSIKFDSVQLSEENVAREKKRHEKSLPFGLRLIIKNLEEVLGSTEISPAHKQLFLAQITSISAGAGHEYGINDIKNKHCESATLHTAIVGELPSKFTDCCLTRVNGLAFFPTVQSLKPSPNLPPELSQTPFNLDSPRASELLPCSQGPSSASTSSDSTNPYPTGFNKFLSYLASSPSASIHSNSTRSLSSLTGIQQITALSERSV